jgi:outer membrane protein
MRTVPTAAAVVAALSLVALAPVAARAQSSADAGKVEHPWLVRLRVLNMQPANKSDAFSALGSNFAKNAVHLSDKTFPEVDVSYFFTKNLAAELVLTYPQKHDVTLEGVGKLGTITHLPPVLSLQYHFTLPKESPIEPYVGLGVNYTRITAARLSVAGNDLDVKRDSFGLAYQVGVDYKVGKRTVINLDYKKVNIATDVKVKATGTKLTRAKVDPDLFSIGFGYRL